MSIDSSIILSGAAQQVFEAAMRLPEGERERLADRLYSTLGPSADEEGEEAFEALIARRAAEIESGTANLVDWEDLRGELQEQIDAARSIQGP